MKTRELYAAGEVTTAPQPPISSLIAQLEAEIEIRDQAIANWKQIYEEQLGQAKARIATLQEELDQQITALALSVGRGQALERTIEEMRQYHHDQANEWTSRLGFLQIELMDAQKWARAWKNRAKLHRRRSQIHYHAAEVHFDSYWTKREWGNLWKASAKEWRSVAREKSRELAKLQQQQRQAETEAAYQAALQLVDRIDEELTTGRGHYWTKAGEVLTTLDQVVRAILEDNLMTPDQWKAEIIRQLSAARKGRDHWKTVARAIWKRYRGYLECEAMAIEILKEEAKA